MKATSMTHIISAVENALTSGRWNDAAPLLSDLLANGVQCTLRPLVEYEKLAGRVCDNAHVRQQLTSRLRMVDDAQGRFREHAQRFEAERLAKVVREHGHPCRVIRNGEQLRCAAAYMTRDGKWTWEIVNLNAHHTNIMLWLGYGTHREEKVA